MVNITCEPELRQEIYDWIVEEYGADPDLHQELVDLLTEFRAEHAA